MPSASFTHDVILSQPADEIWQRLQDAETWANIGPVDEVWDAEHDDDGSLRRYRWSTTVGLRSYRGTATTKHMDVPTLMSLALDGGELAGTLTTRLSQNGAGTAMEVTLEITSKGALSTLFFPLVSEVVGRGLPEQVERFAESFDENDS